VNCLLVLCVISHQEQRDDLQTLAATTKDSLVSNKHAWQRAEDKSVDVWVRCVQSKLAYLVVNEDVLPEPLVLVENKSRVNTQRAGKKLEVVTLDVLNVVLECMVTWGTLPLQGSIANLMHNPNRL